MIFAKNEGHIGMWAFWLLTLLVTTCRGQTISILTKFNVEMRQGPGLRSGYALGTCYGKGIEAIYDEAIDMAQVTLAAINNYHTDASVRAAMLTFWGINADTTTNFPDATSASVYTRVKGKFWVRAFARLLLMDRSQYSAVRLRFRGCSG